MCLFCTGWHGRSILTSTQLTKLPAGTLAKAYAAIEVKLDEVRKYVGIWLQYQALWDMEASTIYSKLGDDLNKWQMVFSRLLYIGLFAHFVFQLLGQIKRARTTFDNSQTDKKFGPLVIDYAQVQASVNNKYDYWHKDVLSHFGAKLGENMRTFHVWRGEGGRRIVG